MSALAAHCEAPVNLLLVEDEATQRLRVSRTLRGAFPNP